MNLILRLRSAMAYRRAQARFNARLAHARKAHQPTRHIEAERREMVHAALRGAK